MIIHEKVTRDDPCLRLLFPARQRRFGPGGTYASQHSGENGKQQLIHAVIYWGTTTGKATCNRFATSSTWPASAEPSWQVD